VRALTLVLLFSLPLTACDRSSAPSTPGDSPAAARAATKASSAEAQRLREIAERYSNQWLELRPLEATEQGDHRFDARFGDYASEQWMADGLGIEQESLERLTALKREKLGGGDLLTYDAFKLGREVAIKGYRYPSELLPMQQFDGLHTRFATLGSGDGTQPFRTVQDYDNFLGRMDGFVQWVDRAIANLGAGAEKGLVQPKSVIERTIAELEALAVADPQQSVFWQPITRLPSSISDADRERLTKAYADKLVKDVLPAYRRLHDYLKNDYLPQARDSISWADLPTGNEWYAQLIRYHTATSLAPEAVHEVGLRDVARIRGEMERIRNRVAFAGDLRGLQEALRVDANQQYAGPGELLDGYRSLQQRVDAALPLLFERKPKARLEVRPVDASRALTSPAVVYEPGSADGKLPGVLYVNTYELSSRPKYLMESQYLSEAVPGRHYQASLAQQVADLPRFRQAGVASVAFVEGWALYAASLGHDLGLYTDAYSQLGALAAELLPAGRVVVDTGIHAMGWTREKAIDYLRANTTLGESAIETEVDRIVAAPAAAIAAKAGQLTILGLRRRAQQKLGPRFDVRAFHEQVLGSGPLPLAVLEKKIERWIAAQK
jgi:uncharacterized protein (DUF885 family)